MVSHLAFFTLPALRAIVDQIPGFLLTISPMRGVNYLDRNFRRHMEEPRDAIFENDVASAIAFVRRQFRGSGTQKWHQVTVEWLLIHLMTEIGITPHADHQGYNAPTLEGAYEECIQQFVGCLCFWYKIETIYD